MPKIIIADTSCFIILSNINELDILRMVYGEITTTTTIVDEFGADLPDWVKKLYRLRMFKSKLY